MNRTRLAEFLVLFVVALAWAGFVVLSGASGIAKLFMGVGFGIALMLLVTIRELMMHGTINRYANIGEPDKMIEIADAQLARRRSPARRAPFQIYKAIGHSMKADWDVAIETLEAIDFDRMSGKTRRTWQFLYYNNLLPAYCFTDRVAEARGLFDDHIEPFGTIVRSPGPALAISESRAKLQYFEGDLEEARKGFESLVNDVRLASASRGLYHYFLGRIARDLGESGAAAEHFRKGSELAPNTFVAEYVEELPSGSDSES